MSNVAKRTGLLVGMVLGILSAFATVAMAFIPNSAAYIVIVLPGLFLSDFTRVHNLAAGLVAALENFSFWFLLCWLIGTLIGRFGRSHRTSEQP
jgi:hypothetical protein